MKKSNVMRECHVSGVGSRCQRSVNTIVSCHSMSFDDPAVLQVLKHCCTQPLHCNEPVRNRRETCQTLPRKRTTNITSVMCVCVYPSMFDKFPGDRHMELAGMSDNSPSNEINLEDCLPSPAQISDDRKSKLMAGFNLQSTHTKHSEEHGIFYVATLSQCRCRI